MKLSVAIILRMLWILVHGLHVSNDQFLASSRVPPAASLQSNACFGISRDPWNWRILVDRRNIFHFSSSNTTVGRRLHQALLAYVTFLFPHDLSTRAVQDEVEGWLPSGRGYGPGIGWTGTVFPC